MQIANRKSPDLLARNLSRLQRHQPLAAAALGAHESQIANPKSKIPPPLHGPTAPPLDTDQLRATTVVYLGIDGGLERLLCSINGEVNVVVVEDDAGRVASVLSRLERPAASDPRRVRWVLSEEILAQFDLEAFFLGGVKVLTAPGREPTALDIAVLRSVKELLARLQQQRQQNVHTFLTMVTYDRLALTRLTLDRLAINTDEPMKLVIIDNASTDGTRQWLRENRARYPFIHALIFMDRNLGIGRALNNGMLYSLSRSEKIGRLDNDILVPPFWLRDLNHVLASGLKPHVVCGLVTDDPVVKEIVAHGQTTQVDDLRVYLVETTGGCCNVYDPQIFSRLGFFPEEPLYGVEDGGLCKAVRDAGQSIAVVDNVKLEHLSTLFPDAREYLAFKGEQLDEWGEGDADAGGFGVTGAAGLTGDRGKLKG